jgi:hypothetical protein
MLWRLPIATAVVVGVIAACSSFATEQRGIDLPERDASGDISSSEVSNARRSLFIFGGHDYRLGDGGTLTTFVMTPASYRAVLDRAGELGPWEPIPALPLTRSGFAYGSISSTVFAAGGVEASFGAPRKIVETADPSAAAPMWQAAPALPNTRSGSAGAVVGDDFYVFGGYEVGYEREIYAARYADGGGLGVFRTVGSLPEAASMAVAVVGSRVYVAGGIIGTSANIHAGVSWADRLPDGSLGPWNDAGLAPIDGGARAPIAHGLVNVGGRLVMIGGSSSGNTGIDDVFVGTIAANGSVSWAPSTPMLYPVRSACIVVDGDSIYVLGGQYASSFADVARGRLQANGAIQWTRVRALPTPREAFGCVVLDY